MRSLKLGFIFTLGSALSMLLSGCNALEPAFNDATAKNLPRVDYVAGIASIEQACQHMAPSQTASAISGSDIQKVDRIEVVADPESAASLVARGFALSLTGDIAGTNTLFNLALRRADTATPANRVRWSHGWAMFNLRRHECALAHFTAAYQANPDDARWAHYTYAVTYWQMGNKERAVQFYAEAVAQEPECWRDIKTSIRCTGRWRNQEKRAWGELFAAWRRHRVAKSNEPAFN
jgi:tetratricopeptide (TPR) repeat protein